MDGSKEYGPIPRFSGNAAEFPTWKFLVLAQLRARDMDHLVEDPVQNDQETSGLESAADAAARKKREASDKEKDKKAFALISSALPTSTASNLLSCKTTRDV